MKTTKRSAIRAHPKTVHKCVTTCAEKHAKNISATLLQARLTPGFLAWPAPPGFDD
jgi:hypothetical protein